MRKMILSAALACLCGLLTVNAASACHRGWGGYYCDCSCYCGWGGYYGGCAWGGYYDSGYDCGRYYGSGYYGGYLVAAPARASATLVVNLPADAVLTIDGNPTTSTSAKRSFSSPPLEMGRDFEYTLEAKVVRDGQERVIKQRVTVRAGQQTNVRLEESTAVAAR
jgi:uncharacterized protein (TIGR03000 family)